jgi:hypothetical protein
MSVRDDKKREITTYLLKNTSMNNTEISNVVGFSKNHIGAIRKSLGIPKINMSKKDSEVERIRQERKQRKIDEMVARQSERTPIIIHDAIEIPEEPKQLALTFQWGDSINKALIFLHRQGFDVEDAYPRIYVDGKQVTCGCVMRIAEDLRRIEHADAMQIKQLKHAEDMAIKRRIEI